MRNCGVVKWGWYEQHTKLFVICYCVGGNCVCWDVWWGEKNHLSGSENHVSPEIPL